MSIGKRIRQLYDKQGFKSLSEFSFSIKINQATLSRLMNDKQKPYADTALQIADFFNVSVEWLLTGREPGQKSPRNMAGNVYGNGGNFQEINGGVNLRYEIGLNNLKKEEKTVDKIAELADKLTPGQRAKLLQLIKITLDIDV